ncbi:unnamed protein product, partial [Prorocentrum cordatum]
GVQCKRRSVRALELAGSRRARIPRRRRQRRRRTPPRPTAPTGTGTTRRRRRRRWSGTPGRVASRRWWPASREARVAGS